MSGDATAVSARGLWFGYDEVVVLEDIGLNVREGEIISIVGPNGSGKSTLLKVLMGLLRPSAGSVEIFGQPVARVFGSGLMGYLPQSSRHDELFPAGARDVVAMARYARKGLLERLDDNDRAQIDRALDDVGMRAEADKHFGSLSGGQKQRVLIARALAGEPKIVLLDEPSTGLDAVAQDSFYQLLVRLRDERGLTIIMVSHDIGTVATIVDRVACLKRKIHFHGNPRDGVPPDALAEVFGRNIYVVKHDKNCETCGGE